MGLDMCMCVAAVVVSTVGGGGEGEFSVEGENYRKGDCCGRRVPLD
jgi:hypothetical protein